MKLAACDHLSSGEASPATPAEDDFLGNVGLRTKRSGPDQQPLWPLARSRSRRLCGRPAYLRLDDEEHPDRSDESLPDPLVEAATGAVRRRTISIHVNGSHVELVRGLNGQERATAAIHALRCWWHEADIRSIRPILRTLGAIAQLGERLLCKQEVAGSIPVGSTEPDGGRTAGTRKVGSIASRPSMRISSVSSWRMALTRMGPPSSSAARTLWRIASRSASLMRCTGSLSARVASSLALASSALVCSPSAAMRGAQVSSGMVPCSNAWK